MQELSRLQFHHIGFAVRSLNETKVAFETLGAKFFHSSSDLTRNLDFQFAFIPNSGGAEVLIEFVCPHDSNLPCAVTKIVEKNPVAPYHICFQTDNLSGEVARLKKSGFKPLGEFLTTDVYGYEVTGVFLFSLGAGLIELVMEHVNNAKNK